MMQTPKVVAVKVHGATAKQKQRERDISAEAARNLAKGRTPKDVRADAETIRTQLQAQALPASMQLKFTNARAFLHEVADLMQQRLEERAEERELDLGRARFVPRRGAAG